MTHKMMGKFELQATMNRWGEVRVTYDAWPGTNVPSSCLWMVPGTVTEESQKKGALTKIPILKTDSK